MQLEGIDMLAIVRKRFRIPGESEERFAAIAAFSDFEEALAAANNWNLRDGVSGAYSVAPLTPPVESWTP